MELANFEAKIKNTLGGYAGAQELFWPNQFI
jgi:hypothetical protein